MTSCKVVSKYFSSQTVMDESLSDFQEKKPICVPKNIQKPKRKRSTKRLKGQKDIRTLVKKQNELISYSNEFEQICKTSGLDVDSEQLQLAIALSKSLQDKELEAGEPSLQHKDSEESVKVLTTQERNNKIKKTLQEYGFTVPDIKIKDNKKKKRRKKYKLLLTTDSQKQQVVSDKYAEILLYNNHDLNLNQQDSVQTEFVYKATSICYNEMKNDNIFYTNHFPKSCKSFLLRKWTDIPGRPKSPEPVHVKTIVNSFNFDNIECTQEELDCILSGSIKSAQDTVKNIMKNSNYNSEEQQTLHEVKEEIDTKYIPQALERSMSPDMFADDVSVIEESTNLILSAPEVIGKTNDKSAFMDLTECVGPTALSLPTETLRKSYDFMEITNCIGNKKLSQNIDLTSNDKNSIDENKPVIVDLSQSSDSNDLPAVQVGGTQKSLSLDDTIILDVDESCNAFKNTVNKSISNDSHTDNNSRKTSKENLDYIKLKDIEDTVCHVQNNSEIDVHKSAIRSVNNIDNDSDIEVDLTQSSGSSHEYNKSNSVTKDVSTGFLNKNAKLGKINDVSVDYDELFDNMVSSINSNKLSLPNDSLITNKEDESHSRIHSESNIDKTIKTDQENCVIINELCLDVRNSKNLQSRDIESSEYELHHDVYFSGNSVMDNASNLDCLSYNQSNETDINFPTTHEDAKTESILTKIEKEEIQKNTNQIEVQTPNSKEFILKTNDVTPMLDYEQMSTPARNKELEKYGIKPFKRKRAIQLLTYLYNQTHPVVQQCSEEELVSPSKKQKFDHVKIPQSQYCNSQNNLMMESNFTSSAKLTFNESKKPNLNSLSPVKSNIVDSSPKRSTLDDISPVKSTLSISPTKFKLTSKMSTSCDQSPSKSNMVGLSPRKSNRSPRNLSPNNNKENIYVETKQQPDIKEIYCSNEDWVFQKREKAKVHSCRIPLHIVFHNYVSCRKSLREAILCYEPVNIDIIHKDLVAYGYRYNPKDLLRFLDKKCITVKTFSKTRNKKL